MAMVARPSVVLLDEHTAALDPKSARLVLEVTNQIVRDSNTTTLLVTHDMGRALMHADRLLMMHRGRIVTDLGSEEIKDLDPHDLIDMFETQSGDVLPDRSALA
jgi:putative ABC transport system ATP-binding protein